MADAPGSSPGKGFWPEWLTPRRAWEFVSNVARLERSVLQLQEENRQLRAELSAIRESVVEHDAQLRLLTTFVRDSLSNRLEARIDRLAADILAKKKN